MLLAHLPAFLRLSMALYAAPQFTPMDVTFEFGYVYVKVDAGAAGKPWFLLDTGYPETTALGNIYKGTSSPLPKQVEVKVLAGLPAVTAAVDPAPFEPISMHYDVRGMLGLDFFAGRALFIDYAGKKVSVAPEGNLTLDDAARTLGIPVDRVRAIQLIKQEDGYAVAGSICGVPSALFLDTGGNGLEVDPKMMKEKGFKPREASTRNNSSGALVATQVFDKIDATVEGIPLPVTLANALPEGETQPNLPFYMIAQRKGVIDFAAGKLYVAWPSGGPKVTPSSPPPGAPLAGMTWTWETEGWRLQANPTEPAGSWPLPAAAPLGPPKEGTRWCWSPSAKWFLIGVADLASPSDEERMPTAPPAFNPIPGRIWTWYPKAGWSLVPAPAAP